MPSNNPSMYIVLIVGMIAIGAVAYVIISGGGGGTTLGKSDERFTCSWSLENPYARSLKIKDVTCKVERNVCNKVYAQFGLPFIDVPTLSDKGITYIQVGNDKSGATEYIIGEGKTDYFETSLCSSTNDASSFTISIVAEEKSGEKSDIKKVTVR